MRNKADIAMNFEASAAVGAVICSLGGVPINGGHIQYWMGQAREARVERDTAATDNHDRIAELNAEITRLRAERDAAAREATHFRDAFLPFVTSSTLNPCEWAKVLNQKYSGLKPITVTVTKFQYQAACRALPSTVVATEGDSHD